MSSTDYPGSDQDDAKPAELQEEKARRGEPAPILNPEAAEEQEVDSAEDEPETDTDE